MNFCILMGSPRLHGNTAELLKPFIEELKNADASVTYITLADKKVNPCKSCYACQQVDGEYGCVQKDDMDEIVDNMIKADCIVFATPIYTWYCTAEMKVVLDRHFGLNKYYGSAKGSLWENKSCAIIATHGYDRAYATEPFETGIKRFCDHSNHTYLGMFSVRDEDNIHSFQSSEAKAGAREFAKELIEKLKK